MSRATVVSLKHVVSISGRIARRLGIRVHLGWTGVFTTLSAQGAYANGTRVVKIRCDDGGDANPVGSIGRVLGSFGVDGLPIIYFVEWDHKPKHAFACQEGKIERLP